MARRHPIGSEEAALAIAASTSIPTFLIRGHPDCEIPGLALVNTNRPRRRTGALYGISAKNRKLLQRRHETRERNDQNDAVDARVWAAVKANPETTSGSIAKTLEIDGADVSRSLQRLLGAKKVAKAGHARWTKR